MKTENLAYHSHYQNYLANNNQNKSAKKTTAGVTPSGRVSFKANPVPVAKTIGEKLARNRGFNWFLDVLADNSLMADALIALGLTAIARPALIAAFPSKDPVEKRKNEYQIGHSIGTGILGLVTTFAVAEPVKRGVKKLMENPSKYMKNDTSYIKQHARVFKETAGRLHQPIFLPLRAAATIAVVPPILNLLGLSKNGKPLPPTDKAKIDYSFMSFKGNDSKPFNKFTRMKADSLSAQNKPSFKGAGAMVTEGIAKGVGKIADTSYARRFINWFAKEKKNTNLAKEKKDIWFPHLIAAESLWLSGWYMQRTARSKTIEKDQKLPMILNQGITAILCTIGAYKLDGVIKKKLEAYKETYKRMNPDMLKMSNLYDNLLKRYENNPEIKDKLVNPETYIEKYKNLKDSVSVEKFQKYKNLKAINKRMNNRMIGIKLLGPMVIFTTIYRFVGPVVVTPIANWISEKIEPHNKKKAA